MGRRTAITVPWSPLQSYTNGYDVRIDHLLSSRQQIFGRWSWKDISTLGGNGLLPPTNQDMLNRNLILSHNYSIRPNLINEFRFGFSVFNGNNRFPILGTDAVATLGIQGLYLNNAGGKGGFPVFNFSDGTGFSGIGAPSDENFQSRSWQFNDNLSWIHGRHTLKFGGDFRKIGYQDILPAGAYGIFGQFNYSQNSFSGNSFADFLLGLPTSDIYGIVGPDINERSDHTDLYAQDQWLVNSRLTLSFGLRWSLQPPMTEASGNLGNFDPTTGNLIVPDQTLPAAPSFLASINACPGTDPTIPCTHVVTASQVGLGPGLRHTYYGDWAPRVGFAWRPFSDGKTVIRSGFGIFTTTVQGTTASVLVGVPTTDLRTYQNFQGAGEPPLYVLPQISGGPLTLEPAGTGNINAATDFGLQGSPELSMELHN